MLLGSRALADDASLLSKSDEGMLVLSEGSSSSLRHASQALALPDARHMLLPGCFFFCCCFPRCHAAVLLTPRMQLFSATQTKSVQALARLSLRDPVRVSVHETAQYATPNKLTQAYMEVELPQKVDVL